MSDDVIDVASPDNDLMPAGNSFGHEVHAKPVAVSICWLYGVV
jgi:hypothetical protein